MNDPFLTLSNVKVRYGKSLAVSGLSLSVASGELLALVGPSGSGKTTTLHLIAGLIDADSGTLEVGGKNITSMAPKDRDVALVFQEGALYPHLTVYQNLAFPLKARGRKGKRAVPKMAKRLGLTELLDRYPSKLSGGERQRVALGRALIRKPKIFLLDEPLANLDAPLKESLRTLVRELVTETGVTCVYVTHDQAEAMAIGDRVAVMNAGKIAQVDTPRKIYESPADIFTARFFGSPPMNILSGQAGNGEIQCNLGTFGIRKTNISGPVKFGFRPEHGSIVENGQGLQAEVAHLEYFGHEMVVALVCNGEKIRLRMPVTDNPPKLKSTVNVAISPDAICLFDATTGLRK